MTIRSPKRYVMDALHSWELEVWMAFALLLLTVYAIIFGAVIGGVYTGIGVMVHTWIAALPAFGTVLAVRVAMRWTQDS